MKEHVRLSQECNSDSRSRSVRGAFAIWSYLSGIIKYLKFEIGLRLSQSRTRRYGIRYRDRTTKMKNVGETMLHVRYARSELHHLQPNLPYSHVDTSMRTVDVWEARIARCIPVPVVLKFPNGGSCLYLSNDAIS